MPDRSAGVGKKGRNKGLKSMSKVNDIYYGWVVREAEIFGDFFCTGKGSFTYRYIVVKGIGISRAVATPTEKRSHK